MNRTILIGVLAVIAIAGCDKNQTLKERNKDVFDNWAATHVERLYKVCQDQYRAGQLAEVESKCEEGLRLDPEHEGFMLMLGKVQIERGKTDAAEATLAKLLERDPKRFDVHYFIGIARERRGDLDGAFDSYRKANELSGGTSSEITAALVEVLVSMGQPVDAQQYLEAHMPAPGQADARTYELAGRIAAMVNDHRKASEHFHRACLMDPENQRYMELLATSQLKAGQFAEASGTLQAAFAKPTAVPNAQMYIMLGDCQLALDETAAALESYGKACQTAPRRAGCWSSLAKGQLAAGQFDAAAESAKHALKIAPADLDGVQILAFALLQQGQVVEAAKVLRDARRKHPQDTTITCLMGQTYAKVGKPGKAREFYSYALRLDPNCEMAQQLLRSTP